MEESIYDIAVAFPSAIVQRYAGVLRDNEVTIESFTRSTIVDELVACGIPRIPAANIVTEFRKSYTKGKVGVFWDIENVGLPADVRPMDAVTALRNKLLKHFGDIVEFKAYIDLAEYTSKYDPAARVALQDAGLQIVDAAHNNRKEVADKMIIVDALWFALQTENATVCIISGDSDFSPLLSKLRMKGVRTLVITAAAQKVRSLREQATFALRWPTDFMQSNAPMEGGLQRNRAGAGGTPQGRPRSPAPAHIDQPTSPQANRGGDNHPSQTQSHPSGGKYDDLLECIREAQSLSGAKKVRRSIIGVKFRRMNPMINYRAIAQDALADGVVKMGGHLGEAWIALGTDNVHETEDDVMSRQSTNTISEQQQQQQQPAQAREPNDQGGSVDSNPDQFANPWYITLRYSRKFAAFPILETFVCPENLAVEKVQEPNSIFYRMSIGPFPNPVAADNFFQLQFGHLELTPRVTRNPHMQLSCGSSEAPAAEAKK